MTMPLAERIAAWVREEQLDALAALEALADPRIAADGLPAEALLAQAAALVGAGSVTSLEQELAAAGAVRAGAALALTADVAAAARPVIAAAAAALPVAWSAEPLTQGAILDAFAAYCRDDLDDVDVAATDAGGRLTLAWRDERTFAETRFATLFAERLPGQFWLLVAPIDDATVERFIDSGDLRDRVTVWDVAALAKLAAARSSVGTHFDWFFRDAYRRKVLPAQAFTEGLLARGIISLGM